MGAGVFAKPARGVENGLTFEELRERVRRIFVVMMENRSFDHVLGHLSLPGVQPPAFEGRTLDGLKGRGRSKDYSRIGAQVKNPLYRNIAEDGAIYFPHHMEDFCPADLPHDRDSVRKQINGGRQDGFVQAYLDYAHTAMTHPDPMGFLTAAELETSSFLATEFAICDRWHAPIPTDTQPNRLMAISGSTRVDFTKTLAPDQDTVFDWLTRKGVDWRVYSDGLSFYLLMKRLWPQIIGGQRFKHLEHLEVDLATQGAASFPTVTFIEPSYASDPLHSMTANDNHPPAIMAAGEALLASVYRVLVASPEVFENALLVITYDEHGGFFDHAPPPSIVTEMPPDGRWRDPTAFSTLGVRVPAFLVSPYARPASVFSGLCDHTSILQLLGDLYGDGEFSSTVTKRCGSGPTPINSLAVALSAVLELTPRAIVPPAPTVRMVSTSTPLAPGPPRAIDESFAALARELHDSNVYQKAAFLQFPQLEQFLS